MSEREEAYTDGTVGTLGAMPEADSIFAARKGSPDPIDAEVTLTENLSCEAAFELALQPLSVVPADTGAGTSK